MDSSVGVWFALGLLGLAGFLALWKSSPLTKFEIILIVGMIFQPFLTYMMGTPYPDRIFVSIAGVVTYLPIVILIEYAKIKNEGLPSQEVRKFRSEE